MLSFITDYFINGINILTLIDFVIIGSQILCVTLGKCSNDNDIVHIDSILMGKT